MEDWKRRLDLNSAAVQSQMVQKLVQQVVAKQQRGTDVIGPSSIEPAELKLLWEKCTEPGAGLASASCHGLVSLVTQNAAHWDYVLHGFLNRVPSARNLTGVLKAVTDLLVLQILGQVQKGQPYSCPYTIRSRPHPFISIVTNRVDSWPTIIQQVERLLAWQDGRVTSHVLDLLGPFFKFVLLDPAQKQEYAQLRVALLHTLLRSATYHRALESNIMKLLVEYIPCLQTRTKEQLGEVTGYLQALTHHLLYSCPEATPHLSLVARQLLQLCLQLVRQNQDITALVLLLRQVAQHHPQSLGSDTVILLLAELLVMAPQHHLAAVCRISTTVLERCEREWSPVLIGTLALPSLTILATPTGGADLFLIGYQGCHQQAAALLTDVKKLMADNYVKEQVTTHDQDQAMCLDPEACTLSTYQQLATLFSTNHKAAVDWLKASLSSLAKVDSVPCHVTLLVTSLFFTGQSEVLDLSLEYLAAIAKKETQEAPSFLPLLLHRLGEEQTTDARWKILNTIPQLATHKASIAPILRSLQVMNSSKSLVGQSLRLVTALWKRQDRCFPQLQKMLHDSDTVFIPSVTNINEILVSKAACIRDICQARPHQHGADMLAAISNILNECTTPEDEVPAALSLQGLYALCEAEVIDIRTTWAVLKAKLSQDKRPLVLVRLCELFSLVPSLAVETPEYENFTNEVVSMLWEYTQRNDVTIVCGAYSALASYGVSYFNIQHPSPQVTEDIRQSLAAAAEADGEDIAVTPVPGIVYTRLLKTTTEETLPAYKKFLTALVTEEVSSLPRGLYRSTQRGPSVSANQNKALRGIPELLLEHYEGNRQPGIQGALAVSVLFSYDPPMSVGRDGKPGRTHIVSHGGNYRRMLGSLLQEVPIQPSDWHRSMMLPQAWNGFIDRCYAACLEARRAELEQKGQEMEDFQLLLDTAWLWTRDKLTEQIKSASRGSPTVQGNCLCALAALAVTVTKCASALDTETLKAAQNAPEYLGHAHWLTLVTNTLLVILDSRYTPNSRIFNMCQQRGSHDRGGASLLAQASACIALSQLAPVFITNNTDGLLHGLEVLGERQPGQPGTEEHSPVLHFFYGLGLGALLARLFEERFVEVSGKQGIVSVWKAVDLLEHYSFREETEANRLGCVLGLGHCLSAMCSDGHTDSREHVASFHQTMLDKLSKTSQEDTLFQGLCIALASSTAAAYAANIVSMEVASQVVEKLYHAYCKQPQSCGVCLALGLLCQGLHRAGHPEVDELMHTLCTSWMTRLEREDTPALERVSLMNGLMALAGSERSLLSVQQEAGVQTGDVSISDIVKLTSRLASSSADFGLRGNTFWMLGHLHLSACGAAESRSTVPSNYRYLGEKSVLNAVLEMLIQAGKRGSEPVDMRQILCCLCSLVEGATQSLSPINWAGVLSPLLHLSQGAEVETMCLKLAISQSSSAPSASMFLSSWIVSPLFDSLQVSSKMAVYQGLPVLVKAVPISKLQEFLERGLLQPFHIEAKGSGAPNIQKAAAEGLCGALKIHNPPQAVTTLLYSTTEKLYKLIPGHSQEELYLILSECLSQLPDTLVDQVTEEDFKSMDLFEKGIYSRCYLVGQGHQPLAWLNTAIDTLMQTPRSSHQMALQLLLQCFHGSIQVRNEHTGVMGRLQWLLELMGHIKNVANNKVTLPDLNKGLSVGMAVFSAAVISWSSCTAKLLLSVTGFSEPLERDTQLCELLMEQPQALLPTALPALLEREPWKQVSGKVIEWLITMLSSPAVMQERHLYATVTASLYSVRHLPEFQKVGTWTHAYDFPASQKTTMD